MDTLFCPKYGASDQSAEFYCSRCGEWLPDLAASSLLFIFYFGYSLQPRRYKDEAWKGRVLE
jgi:hypothetical protein